MVVRFLIPAAVQVASFLASQFVRQFDHFAADWMGDIKVPHFLKKEKESYLR